MRIRQISAAERPDVMFALQSYAFEGTAGFAERLEGNRARMPYFETVTSLVAEEDGQAVACVAAYPMTQNVRGKVLGMAGVASVTSHPAYRRRGYVRALLDRLLRQMTDQGCAVSVLWPFRPSFYARFGYVGLPQRRRVRFEPGGIAAAAVAGSVSRLSMREGFDEYAKFLRDVQGSRHGFALFDEVRSAEWRESEQWVALARDDGGRVVGACAYTISGFGGELAGGDLLVSGPLGRALLLGFFARHVDQVRTVSVSVGADEVPELWGVDLAVTTTATVALPDSAAPMAAVLDVGALDGLRVGTGAVTVAVGDAVHRLVSDDGRLRVEPAAEAGVRLSPAGFGGLVYGVLDPEDVVGRGLGVADAAAVESLRALFPPALPYVFSSF